jgi:kynurenine 3-monooxygenase
MAVATSKVTIVGGGMTGPLLAIYLARRGYEVDVYERRGDMRREPVEAGKSIKLTLAERGLHALRELGLEEKVLAECCIPLRGRAVHSGDGAVAFIPYGKDEHEVIYSFSRTDLNKVLLDATGAYPNIRLHFHKRCQEIDRETAAATFRDDRTGEVERIEADFLVGADGAFSTVRQKMQYGERADYRQDFLRWGYKEISIVAAADGTHQMEKHALHIWPCGDHMLFALPNLDGSFNGVCTLPFEGEHGFDSIHTDEEVLALFRTYFGDALPFMPDLLAEYSARKVSEFLTIRTSRWHHKGKVVLVGDAVHTVVPFYGQGMNAGFEDCSILARCLDRHGEDRLAAFTEYQSLRKCHTDVLADLSVSNFHELRDTVRRPIVAARKRTSIFLNRLLGQHSIPLYTMISHSNLPYAECVERARRQDRIARFFGLDLVAGIVSLTVRVRAALAARRARRQRASAQARQQTARQQVTAARPDRAG